MKINSLFKFFKETYFELQKIQWPSHYEFFFSVGVTLFVVFVFSVFFMFVDGIVGTFVRKIIDYFMF